MQFRVPPLADDVGLADSGVFRTIDGGDEVLLERLSDRSDERFNDLVPDKNAPREACYTLAAWDLAGNEARADPVCVDVTVSAQEHDAVDGQCANTGRASIPALALLALLSTLRRRSR